MKKNFRLFLTAIAIVGGLNTAEAQVVRLVPRTTEAAVRNVLEALGDQNPKARGMNPQDFYTNRFIDELEQTGFMRELAARYPDALR